MAATPLSSYQPAGDLKQLKMLRRVVKKIKDDIETSSSSKVNLSTRYTGLQDRAIQRLRSANELHLELTPVDRSEVYNKLMEIYTKQKIIPNTRQLFNLTPKLPIYMDIGSFRKMLVKMGFMWKRITDKSCVVIEKPSVINERVSYLRNITSYRKDKMPIYYVTEIVLKSKDTRNTPKVKKVLIYAVSDTGVHFIKEIHDFTNAMCLSWVKDTLVKSLNTPSVIVLDNSAHYCKEIVKVPKLENLTRDITDWLDYFGIPYDPKMPKVILYDLAVKCTDMSKRVYEKDVILEAHGHKVLRLPHSICNVTPATCYLQAIHNHIGHLFNEFGEVSIEDVMAKFNDVISSLDADAAVKIVCKEEQEILAKDMALDLYRDELLDRTMKLLCKKTPDTLYVDSDLPSSDSDSDF